MIEDQHNTRGDMHTPLAAERELQIYREFAARLVSLNKEDELLWYVAQSVVGRLGYADCVIYRLERETDTLVQAAAIGEKTPLRRQIKNALRIPVGKGITGAVADSHTPLLVGDTRADPRYIHDLAPPGSELCVPILHGNELLGVLDSEHPSPGWFRESDLETFKAIAALTAAQWAQCRLISSLRSATTRLRVAEREADAANRAKQDFLANISHEVRTPLNGISGCLDILAETGINDEQLALIARASRSSDDLTALIDQLLDFSRIEAGTMQVKEETGRLETLVEDVLGAFTKQAARSDLNFNVKSDIAPLPVRTDHHRVRQILFNLTQNALKFTDQGQVDVTIERQAGDELVLRVCDTGIGMTRATRERVFGRFVQADASRSRRHGGVGLGLAITRSLVDLLNGTITVTSQTGVGTTFTVRIPVNEDVTPAQTESPVDSSIPDCSDIQILLAEDSDTNAFVVTHHLTRCGARVIRAANGREALAALDKHRFDAVLMDVSMPEMDGLEATMRLREREELAALPVIALTAHVAEADIRACEAAGMNSFLSKPIDRASLYRTLGQHIFKQEDIGDRV